MIAYFDRFTLTISKAEAELGAHSGRCDDDIEALLREPRIAKQLDRIDPADIRAELAEHGAWDQDELADATENRARILWIACGNVREELRAVR